MAHLTFKAWSLLSEDYWYGMTICAFEGWHKASFAEYPTREDLPSKAASLGDLLKVQWFNKGELFDLGYVHHGEASPLPDQSPIQLCEKLFAQALERGYEIQGFPSSASLYAAIANSTESSCWGLRRGYYFSPSTPASVGAKGRSNARRGELFVTSQYDGLSVVY